MELTALDIVVVGGGGVDVFVVLLFNRGKLALI